MLPLFENYQLLGKKLPYVSLGDFPTPVQKLDQLGKQLGLSDLFIKARWLDRKSLTEKQGKEAGIILARYSAVGKRGHDLLELQGQIMHWLLRFMRNNWDWKSISMLIPQPNADYVQHNLLLSYDQGAELHLYTPKRFLKGTADPSVVYQLSSTRLETRTIASCYSHGWFFTARRGRLR